MLKQKAHQKHSHGASALKSRSIRRKTFCKSTTGPRFATFTTDTPQTHTSPNSGQSSTLSYSKQHRNPAYLTNPIFYVNGAPHIGHLYTTVLTDSIKRWKNMSGNSALALGGTDEHGIKVQEASEKAGFSSPKAFCDEISAAFEATWDQYNVKPDIFLRTTSKEHTDSVQWMWRQLARNGHVYLGKHQGWYCKSDETFVPETQLIKNENGDFITQNGQEVVWLEEENFKFRLSSFIEPLLAYYRAHPNSVVPEKQLNNVFNITKDMEDISISRLASKLEWSVDVPEDCEYYDPITKTVTKGSELSSHKHKVYVWLDALNIYITGARKASKQLADNEISLFGANPCTNDIVDVTSEPESIYQHQKQWFNEKSPQNAVNQHIADAYQASMAPFWPASAHVVGKDILKFHAVYWPAFLMGAGLPLPRQVAAHGHWLVEGKKMSKSIGNVIAPADLEQKLGIENAKYALMRLSNANDDGDFSLDTAISFINAELSDTIGNLAMRCTGKAVLPLGQYPDPLEQYRGENGLDFDCINASIVEIFTEKDLMMQKQINGLLHTFTTNMNSLHTDRALQAVMEVGRETNSYFTYYEPWKMAKQLKDPTLDDETKKRIQTRLDMVLYHCIESVRVCAQFLRVFVPNSADILLDQLSVPHAFRNLSPLMTTFGFHPTIVGSPSTSAQVVTVPFSKIEIPTLKDEKQEKNMGKMQQEKNMGKMQLSKQKGNKSPPIHDQQSLTGPSPDFSNDFYKLDLRVSKLTNIRDHPNADSLWVLDALGDQTDPSLPTPVVTNLRTSMNIKELEQRAQVMLYNIKPVSFRGEKTFAMIFGVDGAPNGGLIVPTGAGETKIGSRLFLEGQGPVAGEVARVNDKNLAKILENFTTAENGDLLFGGKKVCAQNANGDVISVGVQM